MSGLITGVAAAGIGAAASGAIGGGVLGAVGGALAGGAVNAIGGAISGGSGSGGGGSSGGGGGGGNSIMSQQYSYYGPHPSTSPMQGEKPERSPVLPSPKAGVAKAATAGELRTTPSQAVGEQQASREYQNMWADRLSKYLDYNTRSLG